MTQEEKELLLKDLCTRLPYGVICQIIDTNDESFVRSGKLLEIKDIETDAKGTTFLFFNEHVPCYSDITEIKPYLRPMDSMTEEEKEEMYNLLSPEGTAMYRNEGIAIPINHCGSFVPYEFMSRIIDYLNVHHFDYRGLIPMGLALNRKEYNIFKNE